MSDDPFAARDRLEEIIVEAVQDAVKDFLQMATAEVTKRIKTEGRAWENIVPGPVAMTAAGLDLLTLGDLLGWWATFVSLDIGQRIRQQWADQQVDIVSPGWSSMRSVGQVVSMIVDRLSYVDPQPDGSKVLPADAFDLIRQRISEAAHDNWTQPQLAEAIAQDLNWDLDRNYWKNEYARYNRQLAAILDPIDDPELRDWTRLHDPEVGRLQDGRAHAALQLDADRSTWEVRAERIGRTETTIAYNYAALQALADEGFTHKQWLSTHDNRTRDDHADMDGVIIPLEEFFQVPDSRNGGTVEMIMPGDVTDTVPAHLRINCRCIILGAEQDQ